MTRRDFLGAVGAAAAATGGDGPPRVRRRKLGRTGLEISEIAAGTQSLNRRNRWVILKALEAGVNLIDTALIYSGGQSELALGLVLKEWKGPRPLIATKASWLRHDWLREQPKERAYEEVRGRLAVSLERMGTDHVDILFCPHGATSPEEVAYSGLRYAMERLRDEGKVRFFGISAHRACAAIARAAVKSGFYDVLFLVLNAGTLDPALREAFDAHWKAEKPGRNWYDREKNCPDMRGIPELVAKANIGFLAMKAAHPKFVPDALHGRILPKIRRVPTDNIYQALYRHVLRQPISGVVVGMSSQKVLEDVLAIRPGSPPKTSG